MGIFDSFFKKKPQHLIQENGNCEIYFDNGKIWKKFTLSNGLLDGKYESYTIDGGRGLTMNFKNGKLHGESSIFSPTRNCIEFLEKFIDGVLVYSQRLNLQSSVYELDSPIIDELKLKEQGSFIKKIELEGKYSNISRLRSEGVKFKLLTD